MNLIADTSVNSYGVIPLPETNDGEITDSKFEAVLLINKVKNGAGDFDEDIFCGDLWSGGGGVFMEEIFDEVGDLDGRVERGRGCCVRVRDEG